MTVFYAACAAIIMACALHMVLSRNVLRILLGLALLSTGLNLGLFIAGGFGSRQPPVIAADARALGVSADPLIQALILTAIVIGFALTIVLAAIVLRLWRSTGSLDSRDIDMLDGTPRQVPPELPPQRRHD
ncbi:sodium:proton antiporter [Polymorphobacter sp.]|uniref:sodium:proton antiporter n=1 Tax=Polymorphobacter sp. TaxID=1909290 RepID=UPI003F6F34CE